jgi:hypothetical protein
MKEETTAHGSGRATLEEKQEKNKKERNAERVAPTG